MILYYKFKNFGPFKKEQYFSLKPGKVTFRFSDNATSLHKNLKTSKVAVIAGENAGGKTCFIKSIEYFKFLLIEHEVKSKKAIERLCFNGENFKPQFFEISIAEEKHIYTYKLEIDKDSQKEEFLKVRPLGKTKEYDEYVFNFSRKGLYKDDEIAGYEFKYSFNEKFINNRLIALIKNLLKENTQENKLIINILDILQVDIVEPFITWFNEKLIVETPNKHVFNIYKEMILDKEDLEIMKKDTFFEIFRLVDPTIKKIYIDEKEPFTDSIIERNLLDDEKLRIKVRDDSTGVNEFLAWSVQLWKVIYKDATLIADEMDRVLNVVLASKVLNYIKGTDHKGQFIFSTHNTLHLNTADFMKEQIFFVGKNDYTLGSEIYSLSEFKDYRYDNPDVYKLYIKGLLGAVPND